MSLRDKPRCPACGHPKELHTLGPPAPPQIKGHLGATEDHPGACLVMGVGRVEHSSDRRVGRKVHRTYAGRSDLPQMETLRDRSGWIARVVAEPGTWERGESEAEALGRLVITLDHGTEAIRA